MISHAGWSAMSVGMPLDGFEYIIEILEEHDDLREEA